MLQALRILALLTLTAIAASCGSSPPACTNGTCAAGQACTQASDCQSLVCTAMVCQAPSCTDGVRNGTETDVDCGGSCGPCTDGKTCAVNKDCQSESLCESMKCELATCTDGVKDGTETDVDCGGGSCPACTTGKACGQGSDCQTDVCTGNLCQAASCTDGVKNGTETGVDCGGGTCPTCAAGQGCAVATDCQSTVCTAMVCQAPSCTDNVKNGNETDVDCGGTCPACAVGKMCGVNTDCSGSLCETNTCTYAQSCNALYTAVSTTPSGPYMILPTGATGAFPVYCDMTDNGGGWTMVMKINGTQADQVAQPFSYDGVLWTNAATLNPTSADLTVGDAKFQSFSTVPFTEILGAMTPGTATATVPFASGNSIVVTPAGSWTSLMALMQQPTNTVVLAGPNSPTAAAQWIPLTVPAATVQANCNWAGINMQAAGCGGFSPSIMARVRIGLLTNQENDCCSPDSWVGFGGEYTAPYCYPTQPWYGPSAGSAGGNPTCSGGADVQNMGYVFVR